MYAGITDPTALAKGTGAAAGSGTGVSVVSVGSISTVYQDFGDVSLRSYETKNFVRLWHVRRLSIEPGIALSETGWSFSVPVLDTRCAMRTCWVVVPSLFARYATRPLPSAASIDHMGAKSRSV